jgi:hypothetical protein
MKKTLFGLLFVLAFPTYALADEIVVKVTLVNEKGIRKSERSWPRTASTA